MKYIDADKLKTELNKRIESLEIGDAHSEVMKRVEGVIKGYKATLTIIDSLQQEQHDVDFEIGKYMTTNLLKKRDHSTGIFHLTQKDYATIARHFYELGFKAQKEKIV